MSPPDRGLVLLTGATGYVGGRLVEPLLRAGWRVRCLARRPAELIARVPAGVEVVAGDVLDEASLPPALGGATAAFYLVHSMGARTGFEERDRSGAEAFARAARAAGVQRVVYLGGLGGDDAETSPHLRSRHEVGRILREQGPPTLELRASVVIGSGSLSFELVRALTERLPVMLVPRWVSVPTQPIAIGDLVECLVRALELPLPSSRIIEIGGEDVVSYEDLMREHARQRGLRRFIIRVPVLTPRLSSAWLALVTPLYARVGRKLVESLATETVVRDPSGMRELGVRPRGVRAAIESALRNEDREVAQTRWSDALSAAGEARDWGGQRFGSRLVDSRVQHVDAAPAEAFAPIRRLGGRAGWPAHGLWWLRGVADQLVGGVGLRRGRRHPDELAVGDTLDFWRVESFEPGSRLRLRAEMRVPGRAWLEFEVTPDGTGSLLRQTAIFDPRGLAGLAYWYLAWPLHAVVFARMLRVLSQASVPAPSNSTASPTSTA